MEAKSEYLSMGLTSSVGHCWVGVRPKPPFMHLQRTDSRKVPIVIHVADFGIAPSSEKQPMP